MQLDDQGIEGDWSFLVGRVGLAARMTGTDERGGVGVEEGSCGVQSPAPSEWCRSTESSLCW